MGIDIVDSRQNMHIKSNTVFVKGGLLIHCEYVCLLFVQCCVFSQLSILTNKALPSGSKEHPVLKKCIRCTTVVTDPGAPI